MNGAAKRAALLKVVGHANATGLGYDGAALAYIAERDLDDPIVCEHWAKMIKQEVGDGVRAVLLLRAVEILRAVTP